MRDTIDLNGWWDWQLPGGVTQKRIVPSCYICVGEAIYTRDFELPDISGKRVLLHFEGVHYSGEVTVNSQLMGEMLPYVYYDFDITQHVTKGTNSISVIVKDITASFGPTGGWEDYGGISRDVWIEIADLVGIDETQWLTTMKNNYTAADADINLWLYNKTGKSAQAQVTVTLLYNGSKVAEKSCEITIDKETGQCNLHFSFDRVHVWSPEFPHLYSLVVEIHSGPMSDSRVLEVGFREFTVRGTDFYLNGVKTFLKGVARHEMWGDTQGFTLSREQIEQDLTLIKEMGANFVRLVHYPHSRYTIECAAKIGLMLSEEPGLWWSNLSDEHTTGCALEIMRKTILRDRSNPAIIAWLFFNECWFDEQNLDGATGYLTRGSQLCRSLDPSRIISGANCMADEIAKRLFDETGMDFYTQHPYCYDGERAIKAADVLREKPLVFTEWGGWLIHYNPNLIKYFKKIIGKLAHAGEGSPHTGGEPHLNGMCWWQWQDIYQWGRGLPACEDGNLSDGLVDFNRRRKSSYAMMAEFFDLVESKPQPLFTVTEYPGVGTDMDKALIPLDLSALYGRENDSLWEEAVQKDNTKHFHLTKIHDGSKGIYMHKEIKSLSGLRCEIPAGRPVLLRGKRSAIHIPVQGAAGKICIFGAVTYFDGYPVRGIFGESAAKLTLAYADGSRQEHQLRHGLQLSSASLIACTSRIDARAVLAPRIAKITLDCDWEVYAVNFLALPADESKMLNTITVELIDAEFDLVIYGISVGGNANGNS